MPPLPSHISAIDKDIRLLLDESGPRYVNRASLGNSVTARRVGYLWYTAGFFNVVVQEALVEMARVKPVSRRVQQCFLNAGSDLVHLLPRRYPTWMMLLEDMVRSPFLTELSRRLLDQCAERTEFECISIDATIRCARRIKGQADYRAPKSAPMRFENSVLCEIKGPAHST